MIKVFYTDKQNAEQGQQSIRGAMHSPSASKPKKLAAALKDFKGIEFIEPQSLKTEDFLLCHDPRYVNGILTLTLENGFGTKSQEVVDSLPYTNGAMYDAAQSATVDSPTCALVAGFHHAGYARWQGLGIFCTFNGLVIAAAKLLKDGASRVAIIDCDNHWGNGTDDILAKLPHIKKLVTHITFGKFFDSGLESQWENTFDRTANGYLEWLAPGGVVETELKQNRPDVIIYQAGADVHVNDPYGGLLTTEQIMERDLRMFQIAKNLSIPLAWNLAGGYQVEPDGSITKVIEIHLNTFVACQKVYNEGI